MWNYMRFFRFCHPLSSEFYRIRAFASFKRTYMRKSPFCTPFRMRKWGNKLYFFPKVSFFFVQGCISAGILLYNGTFLWFFSYIFSKGTSGVRTRKKSFSDYMHSPKFYQIRALIWMMFCGSWCWFSQSFARTVYWPSDNLRLKMRVSVHWSGGTSVYVCRLKKGSVKNGTPGKATEGGRGQPLRFGAGFGTVSSTNPPYFR